MNSDYVEWLKSLPVNRGQSRSWVGVYSTEEAADTFEQWQARINANDAPQGVIARWMAWLNRK